MVTFEGLSGCGKTTQADRLAGCLGSSVVEVIDPFSEFFKFWGLRKINVGVQKWVSLFMYMGMFHASRVHAVEGWDKFEYPVFEDLFYPVRRLFFHGDLEESKRVVDLFLEGLVSGGGRVPLASFYLRVPVELAYERKIRRDVRDNSGVDLRGMSVSSTGKGQYPVFWEWLAKVLPFVYVIDGRLTEDEVFNEVRNVLSGVRVMV